MPKIEFTSRFKKRYKKLTLQAQDGVDAALRIFLENSTDPRLRRHNLKGEWRQHFSIYVAANLRIILLSLGDDVFQLIEIGTHDDLYQH